MSRDAKTATISRPQCAHDTTLLTFKSAASLKLRERWSACNRPPEQLSSCIDIWPDYLGRFASHCWAHVSDSLQIRRIGTRLPLHAASRVHTVSERTIYDDRYCEVLQRQQGLRVHSTGRRWQGRVRPRNRARARRPFLAARRPEGRVRGADRPAVREARGQPHLGAIAIRLGQYSAVGVVLLTATREGCYTI